LIDYVIFTGYNMLEKNGEIDWDNKWWSFRQRYDSVSQSNQHSQLEQLIN
jgi:hypothetical protein